MHYTCTYQWILIIVIFEVRSLFSNSFFISAFGVENSSSVTTLMCPDINSTCPPSCSCSLGAMETSLFVDCQGGNMSEFPSELPTCDGRNLQYYLNFSSNMLTAVDGKATYANRIVSLDVSNNGITKLDPSVFQRDKFSVYRVICLHDNLLQTLPWQSRDVIEADKPEVTLRGNPWHCDCRIFWLKDFIQNAHEVLCETPQKYSNKSLTEFSKLAQCNNQSDHQGLPEYAVVLICVSGGYVAIASFLAFLYTIRRRVKVGGENKVV